MSPIWNFTTTAQSDTISLSDFFYKAKWEYSETWAIDTVISGRILNNSFDTIQHLKTLEILGVDTLNTDSGVYTSLSIRNTQTGQFAYDCFDTLLWDGSELVRTRYSGCYRSVLSDAASGAFDTSLLYRSPLTLGSLWRLHQPSQPRGTRWKFVAGFKTIQVLGRDVL